jgi:hypothetical protein
MKVRARWVDWSLLAFVLIELVTGLISFTAGRPSGRWLFYLHGALGLGILLLLAWKVQRVWTRLGQRRLWAGVGKGSAMAVSLLALSLALLAIGSGAVWSSWLKPQGYPNGLNWHVIFGILLTLVVVAHMLLRFKPLPWRDIAGRRAFLGYMAVAGTGAALWGAQQGLNHVAGLPGAQRRFTGSGEVGSGQGLAFPATMWMLDNPAPLDPAAYTLRISGAVARPQVWTLADLAAVKQAALEATLDCTGGWYTTQTWHGVPVASLLAAAQPVADALEVSFVSTTGYRWSVPLSEAQTLLLAQRVGDDLLDHGRGAPLRLVAPGRRGFQWVKWVTEIRVLTTRDLGQWGVIFTSGLEG